MGLGLVLGGSDKEGYINKVQPQFPDLFRAYTYPGKLLEVGFMGGHPYIDVPGDNLGFRV